MASDTFYDRLVAKADERRRKRGQEVRHYLYGGTATDLSVETDALNDEEEAFCKAVRLSPLLIPPARTS